MNAADPNVGPLSRSLPVGIVQLVHYVELHKSGWWDRALDRLVTVMLWLEGPTTSDALADALMTMLDGRLQRDRVVEVLERDAAAGTVLRLSDGRVKLSEELIASLRDESSSVSASEEIVRALLVATAVSHGIDAGAEDLWDDFENLFLYPLLAESGARIYEVLTGGSGLDETVPTYGALVQPLCDKYGPDIRPTLIEFINPSNPAVRAYVLRRLNAVFVREASSLSEDVLATLAKGGRPDRVRVLVDTNFVFSFLRLHDNPSNSVATDLIKLSEQVTSHIKVEYFVLPITIEETQKVVRDAITRLDGVVPTRNLAQAAYKMNSTGLVNAYLEAASKAGSTLSPRAFFEPYDKDLLPILRERGVELFNESVDSLRTDQGVIDDLLDQEEVQKRVRKAGAKPYDANLHDMVLWHFANRHRSTVISSPLDVGMWVCTIDYGFIAFDRHKRRGAQSPPVCLSPSSLIQLLQFWVPRSDALETALVGAIREPLLFLDFDKSSEATTISIIKTLSRFENVGDLSPATVYNVLKNDALRTALETATDTRPEAAVQLVEAAVVEEARRLEAELERVAAEKQEERRLSQVAIEETVAQAEQLRQLLEQRHEDVASLAARLEATNKQLEDERARENAERTRITSEQGALAARVAQLENEANGRRDVRIFAAAATGMAVVLTGLVLLVAAELANALRAGWVGIAGAIVAGVCFWLLGCESVVSRRHSMSGRGFHALLKRARRGLIAAVLAVVASVAGAAVWQAITPSTTAPSPPITTTPPPHR